MCRWKLNAMLDEVLTRKRLWRYLVERFRHDEAEAAFWASPTGAAIWKAVMEK